MASQRLICRLVALVGVGVGVLATPVLAQDRPEPVGQVSGGLTGDPRDEPVVTWKRVQAVLYSQISNPSGGGAAAQDFEAAYDAYDCYVGDDFQVTWADGWQVEQIHTPGIYSVNPPGGPALGMVYGFYGDAGGFPGASVCGGTASIVSDVAGDIVSALTAPCDLTTPTTYWVSVAARMDYATSGQWYVATEAATTGAIARWYNPGDGFANGCTSWTSCAVSVINATYLDMSFEILGSVIPVELQSFGIE
jgi:hypothetical protein